MNIQKNAVLSATRLLNDFHAVRPNDTERYLTARDYINAYNLALAMGENVDNGLVGKVFEILSRPSNNRRLNTAPNGTVDGYLDGRPVEFKVNGGRIGALDKSLDYKATSHKATAVKWVVYYLDIDNSTGSKHISPRIAERKAFIEALNECGAVKNIGHDGIIEEHAIQPSKRKWWQWLESQPEYFRK